MKILKLGQMLGGSNAPSAAGFENKYSIDFDGVDDFIDLGNNSSLRPAVSGGVTISCWCKWADVSSAMSFMFSNSSNSTGYTGLYLQKNRAALISIHTGDGDGFGIADRRSLSTDNAVVTNNTWHHIVGVFTDETQTNWKIYVDGSDITASTASGTGNANVYTTDDAFIGKRVVASDQFAYGNIDEVALFDSALSGAEVAAIYNSGTPTDLSGESDLVGYWRNGDTAGTSVYPTIEDYSSNSNDGTMTNMASGDIITDAP